MPLWTANDDATGAPLYAPAQYGQTPNTTNRDALFNNTTSNNVGTGEQVGLYAISKDEMNVGSILHLVSATVNAAGLGYTPGDILTVSNTEAGNGNTIVESKVAVSATELASIAINGPGTGGSYVPGQDLTVSSGVSGVLATANITSTEVRTVDVSVGGTGYANGDTVGLSDGTQTTNSVFTVTTGAADTTIASLAITNPGEFTTNPTLANSNLTTLTGTGTGGKVNVTTRIKSIALKDRGSFTTNPTVTDGATTANSGTGATVDTTVRIKNLSVNVAGQYKGNVSPNTTQNALVGGTGTGATGSLTFSQQETEAKHAGGTGWALRKQGAGNRSDRVQYEILAFVHNITNDSPTDDTVLPE